MDYAKIIWDERIRCVMPVAEVMTAIIVFTMNRMKHPVPLNMAERSDMMKKIPLSN